MSSNEDTTTDSPTQIEFDDLIKELAENSRHDRKEFLDFIDTVKNLMGNSPEVAVIMCEQIVKSFDVLNKMNAQLANVASIVAKKGQKEKPEDPRDDIYNAIGDDVINKH